MPNLHLQTINEYAIIEMTIILNILQHNFENSEMSPEFCSLWVILCISDCWALLMCESFRGLGLIQNDSMTHYCSYIWRRKITNMYLFIVICFCENMYKIHQDSYFNYLFLLVILIQNKGVLSFIDIIMIDSSLKIYSHFTKINLTSEHSWLKKYFLWLSIITI